MGEDGHKRLDGYRYLRPHPGPTPRPTVDLDISVLSGFRVDLYAEGLGNPTSLNEDTVQDTLAWQSF